MNTANVATVWEQSLKLLSNREETRSPLAKVYLDYLVPVSLDDRQLTFAVRLLQAKMWIEERYLSYIGDSVAAVLENPVSIVLVVDETIDPALSHVGTSSPVQPAPSLTASLPVVLPGSLSTSLPMGPSLSSPVSSAATESSTLGIGLSSVFAPDTPTPGIGIVEPDSRFNFSNYVMGNSNEFAYKASFRVAEAPGLYFNPLFIYGRSGLGKTHLLLSIRNYINTYLLDKRVVYVPTMEFVNDFTNAMAGDRDLTSFKLKYHTCDVLLIDDVQKLEGKEGTTDALFEIFNMFIESKKQIVLSADRSPVEINLDERFTSRFAQGITADIQPPNYEMKIAILKNYKRYYCNFLNMQEIVFTDEAIQKIVELSGSNIRELEGAVSNLIVSVSCRLDSQRLMPVSCDDVESVLGNSFFHIHTRRIDMDMVMRAVESYFKVSRSELLSEKRSKNISHPRQIAMYLIRRFTDMSYPEIGDSFNKDHTTVMYADRNIQAKMVEEVSVKVEVERIAELLTS